MLSPSTSIHFEIGCSDPHSSSLTLLSGTVSLGPKKLERWRKEMRCDLSPTLASSHIAHVAPASIFLLCSSKPALQAAFTNESVYVSAKYCSNHSADTFLSAAPTAASSLSSHLEFV